MPRGTGLNCVCMCKRNNLGHPRGWYAEPNGDGTGRGVGRCKRAMDQVYAGLRGLGMRMGGQGLRLHGPGSVLW